MKQFCMTLVTILPRTSKLVIIGIITKILLVAKLKNYSDGIMNGQICNEIIHHKTYEIK